VTLITSREPLGEGIGGITHYSLPSLNVAAWEDFFSRRDIVIDAPTLQEIHKAYGGNALAMNILCDPITREGGMVAYWQEYKVADGLLVELSVENLIKEQFNRLEEIYPEAYRLLCRMGCYRYQAVPTVPTGGLLCLLWDVSELQQRRVIEFLRSRSSLVECQQGEYWLHPVILAEAISRLRASEDWESANRKAAEFWTESVKTVKTVKDALKAFEAYYHYVNISDSEKASEVISSERDGHNESSEPLGCAFYRLGLLKIMATSIENLVNKISVNHCLTNTYNISNLARAYNILGDICWITGSLDKAIFYHSESNRIANEHLKLVNSNIEFSDIYLRLERLEIVSIYNLGLCQLDLGEYQQALLLFEKVVISSKNNINIERYEAGSYFCIAFLKSALGFKEEAHINIQNCYQPIKKCSNWEQGYRRFFLGLTYSTLQLNKVQ